MEKSQNVGTKSAFMPKIFLPFLFSQHFQSSLNLVISCGVHDACNSIIMYSH